MASFLRTAAAAVFVVLLTMPTPARAQQPDGLTRLRDTLKREPKAPDVVRMALDYYRVSPEEMAAVRSSSHYRAYLPVVSGFVSYATGNTTLAQQVTITNPQTQLQNTGDNS